MVVDRQQHLIPTRDDVPPLATTQAIAPEPIWISHRVQVALIAAGLVLLLLAVRRVPEILTVVISAGVLALLLSFPVQWLSRAMPRWLAVIVTLLLLLGALVLALVFLVPRLIDQLTQLLAAWPDVQAALNRAVDDGIQALKRVVSTRRTPQCDSSMSWAPGQRGSRAAR